MDHRAFLQSLPPEQRRRLTEKSDAIGLAHLAAHWGLILAVGALIVAHPPGWPLLMVLQGVLLVFLFTLLHETTHQTPFASPKLNAVVGHVCGFLLFLPSIWFRYFHFAHHRYTHDPENDPELASPKPETWAQYLWHVTGLPVWASHAKTLIRNARGLGDEAFLPPARRRSVQREALIYLGLYAALAAAGVIWGLWPILAVWIVPLLLGQPFLRLYLMAEHGRCPHVANMFENSRTTFTGWMMRKLAWNMPYHAEHHAYPTVPFHRLPDLHQLTRPHLKQTERGYWRFHRKYARNLSE